MAYIFIKLEGQKTNGGFMTIDGERKERSLSNGQIIEIGLGFHHIKFNSISTEEGEYLHRRASQDQTVRSAQKYCNYCDKLVEASFEYEFDLNTVMTLTIVSDAYGNVISTPKCNVAEISTEEREKIDSMFKAKKEAEAAAAAEAERKDREQLKILRWIHWPDTIIAVLLFFLLLETNFNIVVIVLFIVSVITSFVTGRMIKNIKGD